MIDTRNGNFQKFGHSLCELICGSRKCEELYQMLSDNQAMRSTKAQRQKLNMKYAEEKPHNGERVKA
jgi:hypothetical protein